MPTAEAGVYRYCEPSIAPPITRARVAPRLWPWLAVIILVAAIIRIAMAQGSLWLDEAWSAWHAREAGTPLGVFLGINHDNNHHLNSLWMQAVGFDAPPLLQRALAIATSIATVPVAAVLLHRQGRVPALLVAALFAISPFFANYGSEARGYAPMILTLLVVLLHVDRWLAGGSQPAVALAVWTVLGLLSQLTMAIGLAAVAGWTFLTLVERTSRRAAMMATLRTFAPSAAAAAIVVGGILLAAKLNSGGMRFGNVEAFTYHHELKALFSLASYTVGVTDLAIWPAIALLAVLAIALHQHSPWRNFYLLAMIGFPATVALLHPPNPGHARYYAIIAVALALLLAEVGGRWIQAGGWQRIVAAAGISAIMLASLVEDVRLIGNQRGDPGRAVAAMRQLAPQGSAVLVERPSAEPVLAVAAAIDHYRLTIVERPCPAPPFLFVDRYNGERLPGPQRRCGRAYQPVASMRAIGMTNFHWRVYRRAE